MAKACLATFWTGSNTIGPASIGPRSTSANQSINRIRVPALHIAGWYDTYLKGSIEGFLALTKCAGAALAREHQYLIAGPWVHIPWGDRAGPTEFGPEALLDTDAILLRWFNHWLKDSGEFAAEPRIRHFALGENRWLEADNWPAPANYALYLHSDGRANSRKGDGALSTEQPESSEPSDIFVYEPEVPVLAPGGPAAAGGQFDQSTLELGNNLLVYTTDPLPRPLAIFGKPRVSLHCATSAAHADFTAKLVRVRPSGAAEFICIGIARSSWLFAKSDYAADKIHHWEFNLEPTSCRFAAGDRIRLEIASSAFPLYDRNPGSGVASHRATSWDWRISRQIVHHSSEYPSALYLPVSEAAG